MREAAFRFYIIVMLALIWLTAGNAAQNALEAHRHAHELACHVQADDLCQFHVADHE